MRTTPHFVSWNNPEDLTIVALALMGKSVRAMARRMGTSRTSSQVSRCYHLKAGISLREVRNEEGPWGNVVSGIVDQALVRRIVRRVQGKLPDLSPAASRKAHYAKKTKEQ